MRPNQKVAIVAIVKNEAPYIVEWIAHHQLMGIQQFYIADNQSNDGTWEILQGMKSAANIHAIHWPSAPDINPQISAYQHFLANNGHETDWMLFIDADEYLVSTAPSDGGIEKFLTQLESNVGAIAFNWAVFGSSQKKYAGNEPTVERFAWRSSIKRGINHHFKSIVRPSAVAYFTCPHNAILNSGWLYKHTDGSTKESREVENCPAIYQHSQSKKICWDGFKINHYVIRSWQEFLNKKSKRGRAFSKSSGVVHLDCRYFMIHDYHDEIEIPNPEYLKSLKDHILAIEPNIDKKNIVSTGKDETLTEDQIPHEPSTGDINEIKIYGECIKIKGWTIAWPMRKIKKFKLHIDGQTHIIKDWKSKERNDVLTVYPSENLRCGFEIRANLSSISTNPDIQLTPILDNDRPAATLHWRP